MDPNQIQILALVAAVLIAVWQWMDARATRRKLDEANRRLAAIDRKRDASDRRLAGLRQMVKRAMAGVPKDEALRVMTRMLPRSEEEISAAIERHDGDMVAAIAELWDEVEEEMERDYYEQAAIDAQADEWRG